MATQSVRMRKRLGPFTGEPGTVNDPDNGPDTSSTQARKDNPLRKSKKEGKNIFTPFSERGDHVTRVAPGDDGEQCHKLQ